MDRQQFSKGKYRKSFSLLVIIFIACVIIVPDYDCTWEYRQNRTGLNWDNYKLTHTSPAEEWLSGYQIGNGRMGGRVQGQIGRDTLFFNEETLWSGSPIDDSDPSLQPILKQLREEIIKAKDQKRINELAIKLQRPRVAPSIGLGSLVMEFDHQEGLNYRRVLDVDRAVATVSYENKGAIFNREYFVSHPDQVMAIRLTCSKPRNMNVSFSMNSLPEKHNIQLINSNELVLSGNAPLNAIREYEGDIYHMTGDGMRFQSRMKVIADGGETSDTNNKITVKNADSIVLLLSIATSFNGPFKHPVKEGIDEKAKAKGFLEASAKKSYEELLQNHITDYQNLFRRLYIELDEDNEIARNYQYSRYLMIAGSRPGTQAMMLQGFWNDHMTGPWDNAYHLNENVQKQYHHASVSNLLDCEEPIIQMLKDMVVTGTKEASISFGCRGWCVHHQTDIWRKASPIPFRTECVNWPFGGVWLTQYIWDHYLFSMDKEFLKNEAYPVMKGAALFCLDWLVEKDGYLVSMPSTSPENKLKLPNEQVVSVTYGSTCDMVLIRECFREFLKAAQILSLDRKLQEEIKAARARMLPLPINPETGDLMEYPAELGPQVSEHRHSSHLIGVWSGSLITWQKTPELFEAVRKGLELRGRGGGLPDKNGIWARLHEGDKALKGLSRKFPGRWIPVYNAVPEMILQSHAGEIEILPALPNTWKTGRVYGLRARGNFEIGIEWKKHMPDKVVLRSLAGQDATIRAKGRPTIMCDGRKVVFKEKEKGVFSFKTVINKQYTIVFNQDAKKG